MNKQEQRYDDLQHWWRSTDSRKSFCYFLDTRPYWQKCAVAGVFLIFVFYSVYNFAIYQIAHTTGYVFPGMTSRLVYATMQIVRLVSDLFHLPATPFRDFFAYTKSAIESFTVSSVGMNLSTMLYNVYALLMGFVPLYLLIVRRGWKAIARPLVLVILILFYPRLGDVANTFTEAMPWLANALEFLFKPLQESITYCTLIIFKFIGPAITYCWRYLTVLLMLYLPGLYNKYWFPLARTTDNLEWITNSALETDPIFGIESYKPFELLPFYDVSKFERMPATFNEFISLIPWFILLYVLWLGLRKLIVLSQDFFNRNPWSGWVEPKDVIEFRVREAGGTEVLRRAKRRHPFAMPGKIDFHCVYSTESNAFVSDCHTVNITSTIFKYKDDRKNLRNDIPKAVIAHELGHVVNKDIIALNIMLTCVFSYLIGMFVSLGITVFRIRELFMNPFLMSIGLMIVGGMLWSISWSSRIISMAYNIFSSLFGKWEEFRADMFAVKLGYGHALLLFFKGLDNASSHPTFLISREWWQGLLSDPHPSTRNRIRYVKLAIKIRTALHMKYYRKKDLARYDLRFL